MALDGLVTPFTPVRGNTTRPTAEAVDAFKSIIGGDGLYDKDGNEVLRVRTATMSCRSNRAVEVTLEGYIVVKA